jgi:hypothetical protein
MGQVKLRLKIFCGSAGTVARRLLVAGLMATWLLGCSPPPPLPKGSGGPLATPGLLSTPTQVDLPASTTVEATVEGQDGPVPTEVASLAQSLTQGLVSERDKALALYDWIGKNIRYDIAAYLAKDLPDPSPAVVLASKLTVCEGYARLFLAMAHSVGLEAVMVPGHSRGFSPDENRSEPDHAWNAVKLDGQWVLLDPTWGAGHIDESKTFVAEPKRDWFDTPPEEFVATHLPVDPKWQLLHTPLEASTFWARPRLSRLYFDYGLSLDSHDKGEIRSDGPLQLTISSQKDCRLMATLHQGDREIDGTHALVERQGRNFTISVLPPEPGEYRLIIFVGPPEDLRTESAVVYDLTATSGSDGQVFPKTLKTFDDQEVQLVSPRSGLRDGESAELVVEAPGATKLMAVIGEQQLPFQQDGERFRVNLTPTGDKVTVFGSYDDSTQYSGLLEFTVAR